MRPWLLLPVKPPEQGKSRLADWMDPSERREFNLELFERALALAADFPGLDRTLVVTRSAHLRALAQAQGARVLIETGDGLNEAVGQGLAALLTLGAAGGTPVLVMACDLPLATDKDLRAITRVNQVTIATDRAGTGTNALCLPAGSDFRFHYGLGSCGRHALEAAHCGLPAQVVSRPGLALDLDTIDDLREWRRRQTTQTWASPTWPRVALGEPAA